MKKKNVAASIVLILGIFGSYFPSLIFAEQPPWGIKIEAVNDNIVSGQIRGEVTLGMHSEATDGADAKFDIISLTDTNASDNYVLPYLIYTDSTGGSIFLNTQINGLYSGSEWYLAVRTSFTDMTVTQNEITIKWDKPAITSPDISLNMTDIATGTAIDMKSVYEYKYIVNSGVNDHEFRINYTNNELPPPPSEPDSDSDGMTDAWEVMYGLDPMNGRDAVQDFDGDGLSNLEEYTLGTNPKKIDTDGDGIPDPWEIANGLDPKNPNDALVDADMDGISNYNEIENGTNPFNPGDNKPTAIAMPDQISDPSFITLLDAGSYDPNEWDILDYTWSQSINNPAQIQFNSNNGTYWGSSQDNILLNRDGVYIFYLTVNDKKINSDPDEIRITINNIAPTADAGLDKTAEIRAIVRLNGNGSIDPNNDPLSYKWTQTEGPVVTLSSSNSAAPYFTPTAAGVYRFTLTVTDDNQEASFPDDVYITVNDSLNNIVPTADAGLDLIAQIGGTVVLNGNGSVDSDNKPYALTYNWETESAPEPVVLNNPTLAEPSFIPTTAGIYRFKMTVSDGGAAGKPDTVSVTVNGTGAAVPTAEAGLDKNVVTGEIVFLGGGNSSDSDNDPLTYRWIQTGGARVNLNDYALMTPQFKTGNTGIYKFTLIVNDGNRDSLSDEVKIVAEGFNEHIPIAVAGTDISGYTGRTTGLSGVNSNDMDGDSLSYMWTQTGGPNITLYNSEAVNPYFVPLVPAIYKFGLAVHDGRFTSLMDEVVVTIEQDTNTAPVAVIKAIPGRILKGATVILDGSGSYDSDGDVLTYKWQKLSGPAVTILNSTSSKASVTFLNKGTYLLGLTVNDGKVNSKVTGIYVKVQ